MDSSSYQSRIKEHIQTAYLLNEQQSDEMLPNFLRTLTSHVLELQTIHNQGDLLKLGKASHTVKGALLNLGLMELADKAYTIEKHSKSENAAYDFQKAISELTDTVLKFT